ncbi:proline-rich receptor-like protein kinase PERK12 [Iris pallida]|uniref:Proline-rich receptor-like protein kinase PERK12 n=1 Tax=Iris pallida TaxID=29817 RepID=A0AAX6FHD5_IRIPA|nr:proline-rich receptor-like protein kinase PERK12 [Iris pallida]
MTRPDLVERRGRHHGGRLRVDPVKSDRSGDGARRPAR